MRRVIAYLLLLATAGCGSQQQLASSCLPEYPDICIYGAHDLDCDRMTSSHFRATRDPHNLDANGDGTACGQGDPGSSGATGE